MVGRDFGVVGGWCWLVLWLLGCGGGGGGEKGVGRSDDIPRDYSDNPEQRSRDMINEKKMHCTKITLQLHNVVVLVQYSLAHPLSPFPIHINLVINNNPLLQLLFPLLFLILNANLNFFPFIFPYT